MKLQLVPAANGLQWVKNGMHIFFRQPLAMSGLMLMTLALTSIVGLAPLVGGVLALALLPACTLGMMAATRVTARGQFAMPSVLVQAFRVNRQRSLAMLQLGALYAGGFLSLLALSALADGGVLARLYLVGGPLNQALVNDPAFRNALLILVLGYVPLSMLFWHAPALVHWHGIAPVKSVFFSAVACAKNFKAMLVYGLAWSGLFAGSVLLVGAFAGVLGAPQIVPVVLLPTGLLMASLFFCSIDFSFRDCFLGDEPATPHTTGGAS